MHGSEEDCKLAVQSFVMFHQPIMKIALLVLSLAVPLIVHSQERGRLAVAPEILFQRLDKNGDGRLAGAEIPRPQLLNQVDVNGDKSISLEELQSFFAKPKVSSERKADREGAFAKAANYLESKNGHALLVYHRDQLIFEEYFNGWSADKPHRLASGTKSFSGIMAVAAEEDGLLQLDEKVVETIGEWKGDAKKAQITLRQLLTLTSGIEGGEIGKVPGYLDALREANAKFRPGSRFQYGPVPFQIFGEIMRRKLQPLNLTVEAYMRKRFLDPIGLRVSEWRKDEAGNVRLPSGVMITAREWAKFGLFIGHRGKFNGKQILSVEAVEKCLVGTRVNRNYGLSFWLGERGVGADDLAMAAGAGKQKLFIVPSLDLLVVQFAEATRSYKEEELLKLVIGDLPKE